MSVNLLGRFDSFRNLFNEHVSEYKQYEDQTRNQNEGQEH